LCCLLRCCAIRYLLTLFHFTPHYYHHLTPHKTTTYHTYTYSFYSLTVDSVLYLPILRLPLSFCARVPFTPHLPVTTHRFTILIHSILGYDFVFGDSTTILIIYAFLCCLSLFLLCDICVMFYNSLFDYFIPTCSCSFLDVLYHYLLSILTISSLQHLPL